VSGAQTALIVDTNDVVVLVEVRREPGRPVFFCTRRQDLTDQWLTGRRNIANLETVDLDGLGVQAEAFLLVTQKFLNVFALIALELNHLAHLSIRDDGAIASKFLLDDLQNLLLVKLLRETLDRSQSLTTIALLNSYMNIILRLFGLSCVFVGFGEGVVGLEIFDGHKLGVTGVSLGNGFCKRENLVTATDSFC